MIFVYFALLLCHMSYNCCKLCDKTDEIEKYLENIALQTVLEEVIYKQWINTDKHW